MENNKEANEKKSYRVTILAGCFTIAAALIGLLGAYFGRKTLNVDVQIEGESEKVHYEFIQNTIDRYETTIKNLNDSLIHTKENINKLRLTNQLSDFEMGYKVQSLQDSIGLLKSQLDTAYQEIQENVEVIKNINDSKTLKNNNSSEKKEQETLPRKEQKILTQKEQNKILQKESVSYCSGDKFCKEDHYFTATIKEFSKKGKYVSILVEVKNISGRSLWTRFGDGSLVNEQGEKSYAKHLRSAIVLDEDKYLNVNYNFRFKKEFDGGRFDFSFKCTRTDSNFSFTNVKAFY